MKLTLEIVMDNHAFSEDEGGWGWEAARILRDAADKVQDGRTQAPLKDANGATVGQYEVTAQ